MSAEATLAVMEHATGSDAEWRMLMLMANEANAAGVVTGISMADLAKRMGKSDRGVAGVKGRLKASEQLVVLDEGGGRGRPAVYWINLPGLPGPEAETPQKQVDTPQSETGKGGDTPQPGSPNGDSLPPTPPIPSTTTSPSSEKPPTSKAGKERDFLAAATASGEFEASEDAEPPELVDGLELLRTGKKVDGKLVTPVEMAIAAAAIHTFNRCFEWKGSQTADYGLGANLKSIVMRARDRPSWDASKHVRLVESAWRIRWWESNGSSNRRPTPNVIYGGNAFENVVQDAGAEAGGEKPAQIKKRRTRG